jgi:hypothetical protein
MIMASGERPNMDIKEMQIHSMAEPAKLKLIRSAKGNYQWEISLSGEYLFDVLRKIREIDDVLKDTFCEERSFSSSPSSQSTKAGMIEE